MNTLVMLLAVGAAACSGSQDSENEITAEQQAARLAAIRTAERQIISCTERRTLANYYPLQVLWIESEKFSEGGFIPMPDREELEGYAKSGISHITLFGAGWAYTGSFVPFNEKEFRRCIRDAHAVGLKVIIYTSVGYLDRLAREYSQLPDEADWTVNPVEPAKRVTGPDTPIIYERVTKSCVCHPQWRAILLNGMKRLFTEYKVDGIYIDPGYWETCRTCYNNPKHIHPFHDRYNDWATYADLVAQIGDIVRKHGGTLTLHDKGGHRPSHSSQWRWADYWLVGEAETLDRLYERYRPDTYTLIWTTNPDYTWPRDDSVYAAAIPLLQFPYLMVGKCHFKWCREFTPEEKMTWQRYAEIYKKMVGGSAVYYRQVEMADFFTPKKLRHDFICSVFCSDRVYLAIANRSSQKLTLKMAQSCRDILTEEQSESFDFKPGQLRIMLWPTEGENEPAITVTRP